MLVFHGLYHLGLAEAGLGALAFRVLAYLPGVPVFFVISGFLISASWDRTADAPARFVRARLLRIYPALWAAFLLEVAVLAATGFLGPLARSGGLFAVWVVSQVTIFPVFTPDVLRGFGLGNPNGNLWTIVTELQFYLLLPLLLSLANRLGRGWSNALLLAAMAASLAVNAALHPHLALLWAKVVKVSVLPHLWAFLIGVLAYRNWSLVGPWLRGQALLWWGTYATYCLVAGAGLHLYSPSYHPDVFGFIGTVMLGAVTLSSAFTARGVSLRLLRGNDLSYGLYLVHGVLMNLWVHLGWIGTPGALASLVLLSLVLAGLSWRFVEQPALSRR